MDFLQEYVNFLKNNGERIRRSITISHDDPAYYFFKENLMQHFYPLEEACKPPIEVSATDGSEFSRELFNGQKFVVTRAVAIQGNEVETVSSFHLLNVDREDKSELVKRIMEQDEHRVTKNMITKHKPGICILDGSFSGRMYWGKRNLRTDLKPDIFTTYQKEFNEMIQKIREKETILIYIGKTSDTSVFKRYLMSISKEIPEEIKTRSITDHLLIRSLADFPGYTEPLENEFQLNQEETIKYYTTHILPSKEDTPMKVDIIIPSSSDYELKDIISWLMWAYTGLSNHNLWISIADKKVKFSKSETEDVLMKMFFKTADNELIETRGERRARIRF